MQFEKDYRRPNSVMAPTQRITRVFFDRQDPKEEVQFRLLRVYLPRLTTFPKLFVEAFDTGEIDLYGAKLEEDIIQLLDKANDYIPQHEDLIDANPDLEYLRPQIIELPEKSETVPAA